MENNQVIDNQTQAEVKNQVENSNVKAEVKTEKTFTQADIDKIINKQFAKWQKKMEVEKNQAMEEAREAERLEKMSAEERSKNELLTLKKQLEDMQKKEARKDLANSTLKEMSTRGIDADFLDFILAKDADTTKNRLDIFEEKFNSMVNAKVESIVAERFKGKTPVTSTTQSTTSEFSVEDIKRMSPAEINANWDKIKNIKLT